METSIRCEVIFRGHVQGVGFRWATNEVATSYPVTGYVHNERDGSVLVVAEGKRKVVTSLIQAIRHRMGGYILAAEEAWSPATGEFPDFHILP